MPEAEAKVKAILLGTLMALSFATLGMAEPRSNERYCIEMAEAGGPAGPPQCLFETLAQCAASKTSSSDRCMLNPWLGAREKKR
jgi:hypothetical protein